MIPLLKKKDPERSLRLRLLVLAAMLVPLFALGRVNGGLWPHALLAGVGIGLGHWYSYHFLDRNTWPVRIVTFMAIHVAVIWLFVGLFEGYTVPQAQFAIFAQAITSFDLRYRRSLFNTLIHSLANLYVAASLSRTYELGLYLLLFGGLVLAVFFVAERESGLQQAKMRPRRKGAEPVQLTQPRSLSLFGVSFGLIAIGAMIVTFIFTPRFANNPIVPPFSLNVPLRGGVKSEIINPGVPLVQINGWSDEEGDYFFGFDSTLDLRYRGGLSDRVVMYVRSPSRSYWRSHSFDAYDGTSWSQSDQSLTKIRSRGGVFYHLPGALGEDDYAISSGEDQEIVQSFTIVHDQPNLVFAAYRPVAVFITAESLSLDAGDGLRVPEGLKPGLTYSVISRRPEFDPEKLRQAPTQYPPEISYRYLQLPPSISGRVQNLAGHLTEAYDSPYDKVMALNEHLLTQYPYNFFPPPHKPGAEVVDTFLFEDREGFCEQYVTSLVVMARSLGIPARLVTGYGAGDYNPITNYYEVKFSDAHSWAEVYFPGHGWVPFDPTPGWTPQPYPTPVQNFLFSNAGMLGFNPGDLPLGDWAAGGLAGLILFAPFLLGSTVVVGLVLLVMFLSSRWRRRAPVLGRDGYTPLADSPTRRLILKLYQRAMALLARDDALRRKPWESFAEYNRRVTGVAALDRLTHAADIAAYRPEAPDEGLVTTAQAALTDLQKELR